MKVKASSLSLRVFCALYASLLLVFKQMSVIELFDKKFSEICAKVKMNVVHLWNWVVLFRLGQKMRCYGHSFCCGVGYICNVKLCMYVT